MKPETLAFIKKELTELYKIYLVIIEEWNGELAHGRAATYPEMIIVGVLLQNMAFSGVGCSNYSHEKAVKELESKFEVLKKLNDYHNKEYTTHYAYIQCDSIITGNRMSEDY